MKQCNACCEVVTQNADYLINLLKTAVQFCWPIIDCRVFQVTDIK